MRNLLLTLILTPFLAAAAEGAVLSVGAYKHYIDAFNAGDEELYPQAIPNAAAWDFLSANIPLLDCPDPDIERTYYFRWWTFRKHLKRTPGGWVVTEFLPDVSWAGKFNTIAGSAGHHFYEGRWLRDPTYLRDYAAFWFRGGGSPRAYSFWAADSILAFETIHPDRAWMADLLPDLVANYEGWRRERTDAETGLFWQYDVRDGMEVAIGGNGVRPTINSYQYGDAVAISKIANLAGKKEVAEKYAKEAQRVRAGVEARLWNEKDQFYEVLPRPTAKAVGFLEWRVNGDAALTAGAKPSASYHNPEESLVALNDGIVPSESADKNAPRLTFWNHLGTVEWAQYDFPAPVRVSSAEIFWYKDRAECDVPASWELLYKDGEAWRPAKAAGAYGVLIDRFNKVEIAPVVTTALRVRVVQKRAEGPKQLAGVREELGFTPWYFHLPTPSKGREVAWKQLTDPAGFAAPFGPTTAERRCPEFLVSHVGHPCQWNGPSWPYATSITLTALANVLNDYPQSSASKQIYFDALLTYARTHRRTRADGTVVPWIDEVADPFTGVWLSREMLEKRGWPASESGRERGKDYNHSTFCDLVITGLVGLRPRRDGVLEVNPLVPAGAWPWFCLDAVPYRGRTITILWDRDGTRYGRGAGLRLLCDGVEVARRDDLGKLEVKLPGM